MIRTLTLAALLAGCVAAPASAQTYFQFGAGPIYAPPPVYVEPPIYYEAPAYGQPPIVYYEQQPAQPGIREVAPGVLHMEAPEDVARNLTAAGFRDIGPIDRQGSIYHTRAVDPSGLHVALQISIFTGQIERADVLEARYEPFPPAAAARAPAPRVAPEPPPVVPQARIAPEPAATPEAPSAAEPAPEAATAPGPRPYTPPAPEPEEEPVVEAAAPTPAPPEVTGSTAPSTAAPSTLRDRLIPPEEGEAAAEESNADERDPLVVY